MGPSTRGVTPFGLTGAAVISVRGSFVLSLEVHVRATNGNRAWARPAVVACMHDQGVQGRNVPRRLDLFQVRWGCGCRHAWV